MNAHPDDILVCANLTERREYRQFADSRVHTLSRIDRLEGCRPRYIWLTRQAREHLDERARSLLFRLYRLGAEARDATYWEADEPQQINLIDQLRALSEQNATSSRDYGRGYAKAIEDACALITSTIVSTLE